MADTTPETTQPTEPAEAPTTEQTDAPEKPRKTLMCSLKRIEGAGVLAECEKPKAEALGADVPEAQKALEELLRTKGVDSDLSWRWA
jgi:hypothetical protein